MGWVLEARRGSFKASKPEIVRIEAKSKCIFEPRFEPRIARCSLDIGKEKKCNVIWNGMGVCLEARDSSRMVCVCESVCVSVGVCVGARASRHAMNI